MKHHVWKTGGMKKLTATMPGATLQWLLFRRVQLLMASLIHLVELIICQGLLNGNLVHASSCNSQPVESDTELHKADARALAMHQYPAAELHKADARRRSNVGYYLPSLRQWHTQTRVRSEVRCARG